MSELPTSWLAAFGRLVLEHRLPPASPDAAGRWRLRIDCAQCSASAIVAALPGEWTLERYEEEELVDATGSGIDLEWTSEVWLAPGERAILACVDHWQAGLCGALELHPTDESFAAACRAVLADEFAAEGGATMARTAS